MIKGNELRIGNLVHSNLFASPFPIKVTLLSLDLNHSTYHVEANYNEYEFEDLRGIVLTKDWLLKLGFHKKEIFSELGTDNREVKDGGIRYEYEDYVLNDFTFRYQREYVGKEVNAHSKLLRGDDVIVYGSAITHVHLLQNLYFFLTEEELTVKQPENVHS